MYCGNNRIDSRLLDGRLVMGNRYDCFRKGVGKGLTMPPYTGNYDPIDPVRIYCGKGETLPDGYDKFGNLVECLRKGIGVGRSKRSPIFGSPILPSAESTIVFVLLIVIAVLGTICIFLYDKINRQKIQIERLIREQRVNF